MLDLVSQSEFEVPIESIAGRCRALSEPIRITLLDALRVSSATHQAPPPPPADSPTRLRQRRGLEGLLAQYIHELWS